MGEELSCPEVSLKAILIICVKPSLCMFWGVGGGGGVFLLMLSCSIQQQYDMLQVCVSWFIYLAKWRVCGIVCTCMSVYWGSENRFVVWRISACSHCKKGSVTTSTQELGAWNHGHVAVCLSGISWPRRECEPSLRCAPQAWSWVYQIGTGEH